MSTEGIQILQVLRQNRIVLTVLNMEIWPVSAVAAAQCDRHSRLKNKHPVISSLRLSNTSFLPLATLSKLISLPPPTS